MNIENFLSKKTTKVAILGDTKTTKSVWIVLHGYGQLVQFFIRKFKVLEDLGIAIIAPEAQSRFYTGGHSGRVGATWMTKEERETDIKDYLHYLNSVYKSYKLKKKEVTLLGFSQGGATAGRWYANNSNLFERMILWCSVFPPDFKLVDFDLSKCELVIANQDEFMDDNEFNKLNKLIENNPDLITHYFDGKHDIDSEVLKKII